MNDSISQQPVSSTATIISRPGINSVPYSSGCVPYSSGCGIAECWTLLGRQTIALEALAVTQLNSVFAPVTDDPVADGFAILNSPTPRCSFHAYASVVDNRSNGPILVPVKPWSANDEQ